MEQKKENRIDDVFGKKKKNILSVFYTAGFPLPDSTVPIAEYLSEAGVDMIEIGIPFSDPVADGPVIQESNRVALSHGMTVKKLLEQVRELRKTVKIPVILMGYLNPVMQFGIEKFCREASQAGVDGLILPDLPLDEYLSEYKSVFEEFGLYNAFLISPTTSEERIKKIDHATNGFIYAVSASSTTGATRNFTPEQESYFSRLQGLKLLNPFLVGFGISNHSTYSKVCEYGAGAIIGSAFITLIKNSSDLRGDILKFVSEVRG